MKKGDQVQKESCSGDRPYLIASKEKALCDQPSTISPIRGIKDYQEYLFDGMRLDEDIFKELDFAKIRRIAPMYHRTKVCEIPEQSVTAPKNSLEKVQKSFYSR